MPKSKSRKKKSPKRVLALPDLEQAKTAVLNSLASASGQRKNEHAIREFVSWLCSEPRLAFNRASFPAMASTSGDAIRARDHQYAACGRPPYRIPAADSGLL